MMENNSDRPDFEPLKAIGIFLAVFGIVVMGAAFLDMPGADKAINIVCGLVILGAGALAFSLGWKRGKSG